MFATLDVGTGPAGRRIASVLTTGREPAVMWFGGFRSDMRATKAEALARWAEETGQAYLRFDYSGHGASGGRFEDGTISRWLEEGLAAFTQAQLGPAIFVGSSMGAWIALLAALRLRQADALEAPLGLVLIAPAIDFTERLMWDFFPAEIRSQIVETGIYHRPSLYDETPYPITRRLIEDGRGHLLMDGPIDPGCPVHILQGMKDPDVPWEHTMRFVDRLPGVDTQVTLIRDGDHRLSRPEDLDRMTRAVEGLVARAGSL